MNTPSYVVATAGHVDHGKSTLVRALTGIEPDRWAEEKRRGLTIDLGFAHTTISADPAGFHSPEQLTRQVFRADVAFVDVPGHERFLGNMLAGLGPAPVVMFVVAADEGWSAQSSEHRDAVAALGITHGLVVLTRSDRGRINGLEDQVRAELADTALYDAPLVAVSAVTGEGLDKLRATLADVLATAPSPNADDRVRFWIDRSFTIKGAGTVITGTLAAGSLKVGDSLVCMGESGARTATVRGLQHHGGAVDSAGPTSRVAVNLRGIPVDNVRRGDALLTTDAWPLTSVIDVRTSGKISSADIQVHVGTAAISAHLRPFDDEYARLSLARPLPLARLDRLVLRDPGSRAIAGAQVLDLDPPALSRRGDGRKRAEVLARGLDAVTEIERRGAVRRATLRMLGFEVPETDVRVIDDWLLTDETVAEWGRVLGSAVQTHLATEPLSPGLSHGAALDVLPVAVDAAVLGEVARVAGLTYDGKHVGIAEASGLGPAEQGIIELERRMTASPFDAPEADELSALGLGSRELAAAERAGRVLRLDGIVLLPTTPALAMRELSKLEQPFTTSQARQALDTTRRVAIPLLEHLDKRGWTRRVDANQRQVIRSAAQPPPTP